VVPAYLSGTERALPRGRVMPMPHPIHLRVGTPLHFAHVAADREGYDYIAAELQAAVQALKT
jgi:hypothetical protein